MNYSVEFLNASEAANRLGISIKALRLYEQHGLITPIRTAAGWRAYSPEEMSRASEIVALRALGFSLSQIARVLDGDVQGLEPALAEHQVTLETRIHELVVTVDKVRVLRSDLARGQAPTVGELAHLREPTTGLHIAFDLPWPWGGEHFELRDIRPLNYITGPPCSGKTRFAMHLANILPDATFVDLERLADGGAAAQARLDAEPALKSRIDRLLGWIVEDGGTVSAALVALLVGLESDGSSILVVDMLEQGLDEPTQRALIAHLRCRGRGARPLFFLTRSSAILDLGSVGSDEAIIYCPANHSVPLHVAPYPGTLGYEALASCLASPEVRARTAGVPPPLPGR